MHAILTFHHVATAPADAGRHAGLFVPPAEFRRHLTHLGSMGYQTISPLEYSHTLDAEKTGERRIWITFDDGLLDNYEVAFPALVEAGMTATFFVVTDRVLGGEPGYMTPPMLREMADAGMAIESHTRSHPRLARIDADQLKDEVLGSKARLEDALGLPVNSFCYPYGNFSPAVINAVREAGYSLATSTIRGNKNTGADRFALKRVMVMPGRSDTRFRYQLSPLYEWLHKRKNARRWKAEE